MPEDHRLRRRQWLSLCGVTVAVGTSGCLELTDNQQPNDTSSGEDTSNQAGNNSRQLESETSTDRQTAEPVEDLSLTESWRYDGDERNISGFVSLDGGFFAKHWRLPERLLRFESDGSNFWESEPLPEAYRFRSYSRNVIDVDIDTVYAGVESLSEAEIGDDQEPGTGARLYAFNRGDGTIEWYEEVDDQSRDRVEHVGLVGDIVMYTTNISSSTDQSAVLRGVNRSTGQRLWSERLPEPVVGFTVAEEKLTVATEQGISVYEPQSGDRINQVDITPPEASQVNFLVRGSGTVYTYDRMEQTAVAFDIHSNEILWEEPFGPDLLGLCASDRTLVLQGREGITVAYAADTGERRWTAEVQSISSNPPRAQKGIIWIDGMETLSAVSEVEGEVIYEQEFDGDGSQGIATYDDIIVFSEGAVAYTVEVS